MKLTTQFKLIQAIKDSDDFNEHSKLFFKKSKELIESGKATVECFQSHGGWVRKSKAWGIYFILVNDSINVDQRYYLNTRNGEIFQ
jgi:hypothetical protein